VGVKQTNKSVAIVIPAYNESRNLRRCLDAIARQTSKPTQVIVVDNNSVDDTVEIAQSYSFVTVVHEAQQGIVFARTAGFNAVTADIIGRIDADTILKPGWVEHVQRYYASESHAQRAVTGRGYFYNVLWSKPLGKIQQLMAFELNRVIMGGYIVWGSNMALPRDVWLEVRGKVHNRNDIHEDIDLAIHMQKMGYKVDFRRSLYVGVRMRRVHTNREKLWANLMLWPRTFRVHGYRLWPVAFVGALLAYALALPATIAEKIALRFGKPTHLKGHHHPKVIK
jgi:glycosyltransferase involved in cell wall biosynthesis